MISAIQFPQAYSRDMYIRMTQAQLHSLQLDHLYSDVTSASSDAPLNGFSEWAGVLGSQVVSMAWDWTILDDGAVVVPHESALRTNIMLLDPAGYDFAPSVRDALCLIKVSSYRWRSFLADWARG